MFRSAAARQSDLASHRLSMHLDALVRTASSWFDGMPESVDARIATLDRTIALARDTAGRLGSTEAGRQALAALPNLEHDRRELAAARDSLLNGFSDRQDAPRLAGRRTANAGSWYDQAEQAANNEYDSAAEEELHRRHQERGGEGNPDPRDFWSNKRGYVNGAPGGNPADRSNEPHDGRYEHSQVQEWPPGSGQGWMPTPGGPSHLHPVHGPYTPNAQQYPGPHPTSREGSRRQADGASSLIDTLNPFMDHGGEAPPESGGGEPDGGGPTAIVKALNPFMSSVDRAIALGSRDFLANQDTDDHDELIYRAQRYAANETSTLPVPIARQIMASFVGRVEELIARRPRRTAQTQQITAYEDFDDSLMHITAIIETDGVSIGPDWGVANGGMHVDDPDNLASQIGKMTF